MKKSLFDLLTFNQSFTEDEQHLRLKIIFLNSVFLMAAVVAFGMGFYRWLYNPLMGGIDFGFSVLTAALLFYLRRHKEKIETISTIAIALSFTLFLAIYVLATYNTMRLSLFFLLSAAAFYLKGRRAGLAWLIFILFSIISVHLLPFSTGYSHIDIVTSCVYLIALFLILWNYEHLREKYLQREQNNAMQNLVNLRWRLAMESAGDAVWDLDMRSGLFEFSRTYAEMLGYSEEEIGNNLDHLERLTHPDDKVHVKSELKTYLENNPSGQYVSEHRLRCKDGIYKWILCRGRVMQQDNAGKPLRMLGTHVDITHHKLLEQSLRESNERLRIIFENIPAIAVQGYASDGTILYWNPASERLYGYGQQETLGRNLFDLIIPDQIREKIGQEFIEMSKGKICYPPEELLLRRKDGTPIPVYSSTVVIGQQEQETVLYRLDVDLTEHKEHQKQLEHIAHYDALTGVPNRVLLSDRILQALARTKREKGLMAVCYLDLDGFKPVNDTYGHDAGDQVLVETTRRIKETIREDDTVARLGGDEFAVILVGLQVPEECVSSLNRLLAVISQPIEVNGRMIRISASIGVSLYPEDEQDADTLLRHADQAMYVAKQHGKNRYHLFDADNDLRARSHHEFLHRIRHGLAHGEFELYYQPKMDMQSRRMVGAEALLRWHHPQRGLLVPGDFLRVIENTELEIELGNWVIDSAIGQLEQWQLAGLEFELSINISAYHLQSADFVQKLREKLKSSSILSRQNCLQIEVLETAALEDIARVADIIKECKMFGVGFALDDFGTGYSSLTYLSNLAVDTLKIDQSFVRDMLDDKGDYAIVHGIIALAQAFDMSVVAEGVEDDRLYQALQQIGCKIGQGYGIARPMPAAELSEWQMDRV